MAAVREFDFDGVFEDDSDIEGDAVILPVFVDVITCVGDINADDVGRIGVSEGTKDVLDTSDEDGN